ncbi:MAG: GltB/FmdC/FwdC-like GXGXG domain-containing protein [Halobacteriota archaeon]
MRIVANYKHYKELNEEVVQAIKNGAAQLTLENVNGQRFIADALRGKLKIDIHGTPGNDLGMFMDGPTVTVFGNAQDGVGNTMSSGKIIIHGNGRDILGHSMRGGKIFVRGDVGYRVGIHMKTYKSSVPIIVAGGRAGDFLGEYMAGGIIIILGIHNAAQRTELLGDWVATGQHGGAIYVRGGVDDDKLGNGAAQFPMTADDEITVKKVLTEYCRVFDLSLDSVLKTEFTKIAPVSHRPYAALYACE